MRIWTLVFGTSILTRASRQQGTDVGTYAPSTDPIDLDRLSDGKRCDVAVEYSTDVVSNPGSGSSPPMFLAQAVLAHSSTKGILAWEIQGSFEQGESVSEGGLFGARRLEGNGTDPSGGRNVTWLTLASLPEEVPSIPAGGQGTFVFLGRQGRAGNGVFGALRFNGNECSTLWRRRTARDAPGTSGGLGRGFDATGNVLVAYRTADYVFQGPYWKFWQDFNFTVVNRLHSMGPVNLEDVQVSYWFEGSPGDFEPSRYTFVCRNAAIGCENVKGEIVGGIEGQNGARFELRITFLPGSGELPVPPTGLQGDELVQFWERNGVDANGTAIGLGWGVTVGIESSNFLFWMDEKQDYSYRIPTNNLLSVNDRMAAYVDGKKEFGVPPASDPPQGTNVTGPVLCALGEVGCSLSAAYCCPFLEDGIYPVDPPPNEGGGLDPLSPEDSDPGSGGSGSGAFEWWWPVLAISGSAVTLAVLALALRWYRQGSKGGLGLFHDHGFHPFVASPGRDSSSSGGSGRGQSPEGSSSPASSLEHVAVDVPISPARGISFGPLSVSRLDAESLPRGSSAGGDSIPALAEMDAPAIPTDAPGGAEEQFLVDVKQEDILGQGAFGTVYRGTWGNQQVALKVLNPDFASQQQRDSMQREIQILSRLNHPNIVKFYGAYMHDGGFCIVEELVEGGSLHDALHKKGKRFTYEQILQLGRDVACAMTYLQPTVIHRDLKSQNVLLASDGHAKVCDFGIARFKEGTYLSGFTTGMGTAAYMAPELFDSGRITEKCDVYSFGILLWELVTAKVPWSGFSSIMQFVLKVGVQKKRLPLPEDCPKKLRSMIQKCWYDDPHKRPSFAELLRKFDLLLKEAMSPSTSSSMEAPDASSSTSTNTAAGNNSRGI